jgi:outer membrane murein-binding lipoprotein Lpp
MKALFIFRGGTMMNMSFGKALPVVLIASTLALGACASRGSVDDLQAQMNSLKADVAQLRQEQAATRAEAQRASQQASAAAQEARSAAAAANAAAERVDRMFQKGLRK